MANATTTTSAPKRKTARNTTATPAVAPSIPRPAGKLGAIVDHLAAKTGATVDELVAATGWQRHSVLGALSRLRARGFAMRFDADADRKAYRLDGTAKPAPQSRARG